MLRGDCAEYRRAMTQLFASVDPLGLLAAGAPEDEYELEISWLLKWREPVGLAQVYLVFADQAIAPVDAARLVAGIAAIRARLGYESSDEQG